MSITLYFIQLTILTKNRRYMTMLDVTNEHAHDLLYKVIHVSFQSTLQ